MGISFSCPFAKYSDVEDSLDSVVVKSINFGNEEVKTPVRSVSFKNKDSEPTILKSLGSGKMTVEASVSFKSNDMEKMISTKSVPIDINNSKEMDDQFLVSDSQVEKIHSALLDLNNPKHMAAVKLQKVYKSFRTRRKLADCAILVEQSWYIFISMRDFAFVYTIFFTSMCLNVIPFSLTTGGSS